MDISARAVSLADRPQWAIWVTSVRMRREDRSSISFFILSQTSAGKTFVRLAMRSRGLNPDCLESDLVDDAGALTDQPLPHPVQRLQVELLGGLRRHELHRRALHRLGDRLGIAEVVLLPSRVRTHIFGWHQPSVVTKRCEFAAQMMRADAGLHADQTRRQVGEPSFHLAA